MSNEATILHKANDTSAAANDPSKTLDRQVDHQGEYALRSIIYVFPRDPLKWNVWNVGN